MDDCIFCGIAAGKIPADIVAQDEQTITFMDIAPATRGHLLVIPRRHVRDLLEATPDDAAAIARAAQKAAQRVIERLEADGVNLINSNRAPAWQTVFHLHFHVIPRFRGDPLRLPWEPKQGDPEEIAATAAILR
jgi:histidine triad (HIT) family protein